MLMPPKECYPHSLKKWVFHGADCGKRWFPESSEHLTLGRSDCRSLHEGAVYFGNEAFQAIDSAPDLPDIRWFVIDMTYVIPERKDVPDALYVYGEPQRNTRERILLFLFFKLGIPLLKLTKWWRNSMRSFTTTNNNRLWSSRTRCFCTSSSSFSNVCPQLPFLHYLHPDFLRFLFLFYRPRLKGFSPVGYDFGLGWLG